MNNFQGVIFDLDETLTNGFDEEKQQVVDIHYLSWVHATKKLGLELSRETHQKNIRGHSSQKINAWFIEHYGLEPDTDVHSHKLDVYINQIIPEYLAFLPGVEDGLAKLKENNIPIGIVSNTDGLSLDTVTSTLNMNQYIDSKYWFSNTDAQEHGFRAKPDPQGIFEIAKRLNIDPKKSAYAGDTIGDMKAAVAAEMFAIGVSGATSASELEAYGADLVVTDFSEIVDLFV